MLRPELSLLPAQGIQGTGNALLNAGNTITRGFQIRDQRNHRNKLLELSQQQTDRSNRIEDDQLKRQKALQNMELLSNSADALISVPQEQRAAQLQTLIPQLSRFIPEDRLAALSQQPLDDVSLRNFKNSVSIAQQKLARTADQQNFDSLTEGLSPEEKENARLIKLGLKPRAQGSSAITIANTEGLSDQVADSQKTIKASEAAGTSQGKGEENRAQDLINRGVAAAESTATIRRAIDLLDAVETGGFDAVALRAKQFFGVEGADEGELSNSLGKSVLSQLRETFGAAFTQEEGARLERIEASFSKSPETNKRLLRQALRLAERTATRALGAARERDDLATVEDIEDLLSFRLDDTQSAPEGSSLDDLINQYAD